MNASYEQRYAAQIPVLGQAGQERLRAAAVHVSGLGGLGNIIAVLLQASGVGRITANDPQILEADNLGRFLCATAADLGLPKVEAAAKFFASRPDFSFEGVVAPTEAAAVDCYYEQTDWIVCVSNTAKSRITAAAKALGCGKPILDAGVADGRLLRAGAVRYKLPSCPWAACPACFIEPGQGEVERGEGLLLPVLAATAALAVHVLVQLLATDAEGLRQVNVLFLSLDPPFGLEAFAVEKRPTCPACGSRTRDAMRSKK